MKCPICGKSQLTERPHPHARTSPFRATYDPEAEAVYVYLSGKPHARTVEVSDEVNVDLDADGVPIGVEVLGVVRAVSEEGSR